MMQDVFTVMWKELRSLLLFQGSKRSVLLGLSIPVIMIAIVLPIQVGPDFVRSPLLTIVPAGVVPMLLVGLKVPDAIAGERERKTLETLLASRLPDGAILYGKLGVAVGFGWLTTILVMVLALVTVNVAHWSGKVIMFSPSAGGGILTFALLVALFVGALGVIISRRAETSQRASQTLIFALLVVPMAVQVAAMVALGAGDEGRALIRSVIDSVTSPTFAWGAMGALAVVDAALVWVAKVRFQRARLIEG